MYRKKLNEDGMLFVLKHDSLIGIFMLNMRFKINIFWLSKKGRIVYAIYNAKPCSSIMKCIVYKPKIKARYVLETKTSIKMKINEKVIIPLPLQNNSQ